MKRLLFSLILLVGVLVANTQGGPWKWDPFPAHGGEFPSQGNFHPQYRGDNDYMRIEVLEWYGTSPASDRENFYIMLTNYTDHELQATVSIREMGIEREITLPPNSTDIYPLGRYPDHDEYENLLLSGLHLFVQVSQEDYHFMLGWFVFKPGAWNAAGGGFIEHSPNYGYNTPNK